MSLISFNKDGKFRLTYNCGHKGSVSIYDCSDVSQCDKEFLENMLCPECAMLSIKKDFFEDNLSLDDIDKDWYISRYYKANYIKYCILFRKSCPLYRKSLLTTDDGLCEEMKGNLYFDTINKLTDDELQNMVSESYDVALKNLYFILIDREHGSKMNIDELANFYTSLVRKHFVSILSSLSDSNTIKH